MNVLSLFDGMSCGQIALERAGISVDKYYAAELDKWAIQVTQANYPDTIQLGDVTKWRDWDIDWSSIDLLIGGSPCQGFSFAGKQLAFDDPRSKLFFVYVDILNHIRSVNPSVKFLLENVKMKKEYLDVISEQLGVEPVFINSALVSAQNRQRYYWANWSFGQPEDKGIVLADIIEDGFVDRDKSLAVTTRVSGATEKRYFEKSMHQIVFASCTGRNPRIVMQKQDGLKSNTLTANYYKGLDADGRPGIALVEALGVEYHESVNLGFRKLTPTECERLQTVPDGYTAHVSNTQRYKMLGNGWTVDVIAHIFESAYEK